MTGEIVEHVRFGRGVVTAFEPPRIDVRFDSECDRVRRFAYPAATARFLRFENPAAAEQARRDLEQDCAAARQDTLAKIEASRRREEQINALRMEAQRKKRVDSAKKAAERRKAAMAQRRAATGTEAKESGE